MALNWFYIKSLMATTSKQHFSSLPEISYADIVRKKGKWIFYLYVLQIQASILYYYSFNRNVEGKTHREIWNIQACFHLPSLQGQGYLHFAHRGLLLHYSLPVAGLPLAWRGTIQLGVYSIKWTIEYSMSLNLKPAKLLLQVGKIISTYGMISHSTYLQSILLLIRLFRDNGT